MYEITRRIASGSFGTVFAAEVAETKQAVAIKAISVDTEEFLLDPILKEIEALKSCKSQFLITCLDSYVSEGKVFIVMEFMDMSAFEIRSFVELTQAQVCLILRDAGQGLRYLHENDFLHRDLKAANVLCRRDGTVKLGDFGCVGKLVDGRRSSFVGTPYWFSPELASGKSYGKPSDLWSFAILAIELIRGEPPMAQLDPLRAVSRIAKLPPPVLDGSYSPEMRAVLESCLQKDPAERPSIQAVLQSCVFNIDDTNQILVDSIEEAIRSKGNLSAGTATEEFSGSFSMSSFDLSSSNGSPSNFGTPLSQPTTGDGPLTSRRTPCGFGSPAFLGTPGDFPDTPLRTMFTHPRLNVPLANADIFGEKEQSLVEETGLSKQEDLVGSDNVPKCMNSSINGNGGLAAAQHSAIRQSNENASTNTMIAQIVECKENIPANTTEVLVAEESEAPKKIPDCKSIGSKGMYSSTDGQHAIGSEAEMPECDDPLKQFLFSDTGDDIQAEIAAFHELMKIVNDEEKAISSLAKDQVPGDVDSFLVLGGPIPEKKPKIQDDSETLLIGEAALDTSAIVDSSETLPEENVPVPGERSEDIAAAVEPEKDIAQFTH